MIDLTPIFNAIITLLAALVTGFVIPWVKKKISAEKRNEFLDWVGIAVKAAEQLFSSEQSLEKKAYVVTYLNSKGYKLSAGDLSNAIEAAVLELHNELYVNWVAEETPAVTEENCTTVNKFCEDFWRDTDDGK